MLRALNWPYKAISVITLHSITVIKLQLPLDLCFHSSSGINSLKWLRSIVSFHWWKYLDSCSISLIRRKRNDDFFTSFSENNRLWRVARAILRYRRKFSPRQKYFNRSRHNFGKNKFRSNHTIYKPKLLVRNFESFII